MPIDGAMTFQIIIFSFMTVSLLLQYLNLYRSVWWLPHSYNNSAMVSSSKEFFNIFFFWKKTLKFPWVKAQISSFEGCLLLSVKYLAEIVWIYICFSRFSWEILPISTGSLTKLEICALTLGNFRVYFQWRTY